MLTVVFFTCYGHAIIKIEVHYEFTILPISCNYIHVLFYFSEIVYTHYIQYNIGTIMLSIFTLDNHIHNAPIVCVGIYTATRMLKLL